MSWGVWIPHGILSEQTFSIYFMLLLLLRVIWFPQLCNSWFNSYTIGQRGGHSRLCRGVVPRLTASQGQLRLLNETGCTVNATEAGENTQTCTPT